jgi:putative photosynthetic complex assembly protein
MSEHSHDIKTPLPLLLGAAAMIVGVTLFVAMSQITGMGKAELAAEAAVETIYVRFNDEPDGGVGAYHSETRVQLIKYGPGEGGFVRTALRSLAFDRHKAGIGSEPPFELMRSAKNNVVLHDPMTGKSITLDAFGDTNQQDFVQLFAASAETATP